MGEAKMKVQIMGYGVVGKAQEFLMCHLEHEVTVYDPYIFPERKLKRDVDVTFICTPEGHVEEALQTLIKNNVEGLYVIKSTVPVGTTKILSEKYNVHICHNPEFIREKHAFDDVINPDRIVIGQCCDAHGQLLFDLYSPLKKPIFVTTSTVSELTKLVSNAYLSTLITFWNEIAELSQALNVSVSEVANITCADRRISKYGTSFFGKPFGGSCLPKDLNHMIDTFKRYGLNPILFEAVRRYNDALRRKVEKNDY